MKLPSDDEVLHQYYELRPKLDRLKDEVIFVLQEALEKNGIKIHAIHSRVKEVRSVLGKKMRIEQEGGKQLSLENIIDLVGLRVVCLFLSDIPRIGSVLRECFSVLQEDNKIDGADITSFGYQSVHFICELPASYAGPRYDQLKSMQFEVQVRTIAMDAWAATSHYLDYKSEVGVPVALRKDFYALSGLFYVADTHFEMFYKEAQRSREELRTITSTDDLRDRLLDMDTLTEYLADNFSDRKRGDHMAVSELLNELMESGFKTVGDLDDKLKRGMPAFLEYEKDNPPGSKNIDDENSEVPNRFADVGVVRVLLEITDDNFLNVRRSRDEFADEYIEKFMKYRKFLK